MKLSMKSLAALLMMLNGAVMASENVNTPENRQFLKQQENLSRQLREKPDHQLKRSRCWKTPFSVQITISWMSWFVNSRLRRTGNPGRVLCILCRFPFPKRG